MTDLAPFNQIKQCRYGPMLYNINDAYVGRSLDLYGEFSEGETELFRQFLGAGDVVVDVGANIGAHTVYFAQTVGMTGAVYAFEPQRIVFQTLCANLAMNQLVNVIAQQAACAEEAGTVRVPCLNPAVKNNFGGLSLTEVAEGEPVPVIRLDSLGLGRCRLLKVDVEGMEVNVLRGATDLIARCRPILYVENDRPAKSAELLRFIDSLGYAMFWHKPFLYSAGNFLKNATNVFPGIVSLNVMCVPREHAAGVTNFEAVMVP